MRIPITPSHGSATSRAVPWMKAWTRQRLTKLRNGSCALFSIYTSPNITQFCEKPNMPNPFRPIRTNNLTKLLAWCRAYNREGACVVPVNVRFSIGLYQIGQAMEWEQGSICTNAPASQAYAAAALHWMMVSEYLDLPLESSIDYTMSTSEDGNIWPDIRTIAQDNKWSGYRDLLFHACKAQQQVHYYATGRGRIVGKADKSRFCKETLNEHLSLCIRSMIACIPSQNRAKAFHDETCIITGDIIGKTTACY